MLNILVILGLLLEEVLQHVNLIKYMNKYFRYNN